jgi:hypothetical protein
MVRWFLCRAAAHPQDNNKKGSPLALPPFSSIVRRRAGWPLPVYFRPAM